MRLHHYFIYLFSEHAIPRPGFDRMYRVTSILSTDSLKHHLLSAFTILIILRRTIDLSLAVSLLSVQIQWTGIPAAHQAVAHIGGEERDGRQFSVFHQFANCSKCSLSPNYASIKVMNSLFILLIPC